jgi:hypothetical protein
MVAGLSAGLLLLGFSAGSVAQDVSFCNPLNLDYGPYSSGSHGADPVIVPFKGKYYLFDTCDRTGYRVSEDLVHWTTILFDDATAALAVNKKGEIIAPAAYTDGKSVYFVPLGGKNMLRSSDPSTGKWELAGILQNGAGDPDLFLDDDGKLYMISGMGETAIWEINPSDWSTIKGTRIDPLPRYKTVEDFEAAHHPYGLFYGGHVYHKVDWNQPDALDTSHLDLRASTGKPTIEGKWMTKYHGRYYLQNADPDTSCPWYSDDVWEADSIKGPYKLADYSPASMKVGGFINSAGHSCVFQDFHGNWWRVTTMWIGAFTGFERRIGLFPAGFDAKGRMFTDTALGDYPLLVPPGLRDSRKSQLAGWWLLSRGKSVTASSTLDDKHQSALATDENVRTWWSAKSGNPGEWFQMDLGKVCTVNAIQVNFAEQEVQNKPPLLEDYHGYRLLVSENGEDWTTAIDKSANKTSIPHDYTVFTPPLHIRYLKVLNEHAARRGKFALRDLRVFGSGGGKPPLQVAPPAITRGNPAWNVTFQWSPVPDADGYIIRYGLAPDALHLNLQVQGGTEDHLTVSCLNADVKYYYRVDAYNDSGFTPGVTTTQAK